MAIKALDLSKTTDFILPDDDGDDPTIWKIGTLSSRDKGAIRDSATSFSFSNEDLSAGEGNQHLDTKIEKSRMNFEAVRRGLKGWDNFLDSNGKPVPFKTAIRDINGVKKSVVPNELMDLIPLAVIDALAERIMADGATEADAKNSPEPSSGGSSTQEDAAESVH